MEKDIQEGSQLYHLTSIGNLENIFKNGLLSRKDALDKKLIKDDVANSEIIAKRKELSIDDCVPFHFCELTPFVGAVLKDHKNKDKKFCYIAITRKFAKEQKFKICTAHPLSKNPKAEIKSYDDGFKSIDWESVKKRDYKNEVSKNACMAECLATKSIMPKDFSSIYVPNEETKNYIKTSLEKVNKDKSEKDKIKITIEVKEDFFPKPKCDDNKDKND